MDVKGIKNLISRPVVSTKSTDKAESEKQAKQVDTLNSANTSGLVANTEVKVERRKVSDHAKSQERINKVISSLNVADEAAEEIDKLVKSVAGIVDQIEKPTTSTNRKQALSNEAGSLVAEIKKQSDVSITPLQEPSEASTKVEIARKLEQSLKALFNEGHESAFGISDLGLDRKESIIQVRSNIAVAKGRIENLRHHVSEAKKFVETSMVELDVAAQNTEASEASVRHVEDALKLASQTGKFITKSPVEATAANRVSPESLRLLD